MFNVFGDINWISVLLATLASSVLGGVWFAALFAKQYARALGRDPEQPLVMTGLSYAGPLAYAAVNATFFALAGLIWSVILVAMR